MLFGPCAVGGSDEVEQGLTEQLPGRKAEDLPHLVVGKGNLGRPIGCPNAFRGLFHDAAIAFLGGTVNWPTFGLLEFPTQGRNESLLTLEDEVVRPRLHASYGGLFAYGPAEENEGDVGAG